MKKQSSLFLCLLLLCLLAATSPAQEQRWAAYLIPASLNDDNTVHLVAGQTQALHLIVQANKDVIARGDSHSLKLEFDFPQSIDIVHADGPYKLSRTGNQATAGRRLIQFDATLANPWLSNSLRSEWRNQPLFVQVPSHIEPGQGYLRLRLTDGNETFAFQWPLQLHALPAIEKRPTRTTIGLWDYSYYRAMNESASQGIAQFFRNSGINFTQKTFGDVYPRALHAANIGTGGSVHHSVFYHQDYQDYNAAGQPQKNNYPGPQAILNLPPDAIIPGVKELIEKAKTNRGIASLDFEPSARRGWAPADVAAFKQKYAVSDADFEAFRQYVAQHSLETAQSTDPLISRLWRDWTEFRTDQSSNYVRRLVEAVKKQDPGVRIAVTSSKSYGANTARTLALGTDNSAMAQYADIIMPQFYYGYGSAQAKLVMQMTQGWRQAINSQGAKTEMWPILLARYSGAKPFNTPQRLKQQIIGSLAHGANGVLIYYPGNMDAPYWQMLAGMQDEISRYENFYHQGQRVEELFKLDKLPTGTINIPVWPNYQETVENPGWAFTAHRLNDEILLTLMNLEEANDLLFEVTLPQSRLVSSRNIASLQNTRNVTLESKQQWLLGAGQIGYVVLKP